MLIQATILPLVVDESPQRRRDARLDDGEAVGQVLPQREGPEGDAAQPRDAEAQVVADPANHAVLALAALELQSRPIVACVRYENAHRCVLDAGDADAAADITTRSFAGTAMEFLSNISTTSLPMVNSRRNSSK